MNPIYGFLEINRAGSSQNFLYSKYNDGMDSYKGVYNTNNHMNTNLN